MDLLGRVHDGEVRCPYCHDALEAEALDIVTCPGCRTRHHVACVQELGHCSVHGCGRALPEAEPRQAASPEIEALRRRIRERARRYASRQARTPGPATPPPAEAPAEGPPGLLARYHEWSVRNPELALGFLVVGVPLLGFLLLWGGAAALSWLLDFLNRL